MVCPVSSSSAKSRERKSLWVDTFIQLADGKLNGQKAFMTGALKVKGNVMLAVSSQALHLIFTPNSLYPIHPMTPS
jgi:putative sterol carrier protein